MEALVRLAIGFVLLTAAVAKLRSVSQFKRVLAQSIGWKAASAVGILVIGCELIVGLALVAGYYVWT